MTEGSPEGATQSANEPSGYEIVILLPRGEGRDVASMRGADDIVSLPRVAVADEPETPAIIAAIAGILAASPRRRSGSCR